MDNRVASLFPSADGKEELLLIYAADVENKPDSSFPVKRKPDLCCQGQANKAQKLNPESRDEEVSVSDVENLNSSTEASVSLEKAVCSVSEEDGRDFAAEEKQDGVGKEEEEEDDSIVVEIDRKGKGISREDKRKGKLIELGESDDSDDEEDEDGDEFDLR
ncbi:hypothetical protein Bca4012_070376 [Brassica carinata]|uniref:Uncharacterized protein n=1 Tax=Brassica carinata TaxID=52824 RepID=A0A8X7U6H3_BRACI|nr:hypothetical protein Bca52824_062620 [Brassica carinata]